jgi:hypothetical protein
MRSQHDHPGSATAEDVGTLNRAVGVLENPDWLPCRSGTAGTGDPRVVVPVKVVGDLDLTYSQSSTPSMVSSTTTTDCAHLRVCTVGRSFHLVRSQLPWHRYLL